MRSGGKITDVSLSGYPGNFHSAEVVIGSERLFILLNAHYPYLAFASEIEYGSITFVDKPELEQLFSAFYRVLNTDELNAAYTGQPDSSCQLSSADIEQLAYWKPETIGEIIFNRWD